MSNRSTQHRAGQCIALLALAIALATCSSSAPSEATQASKTPTAADRSAADKSAPGPESQPPAPAPAQKPEDEPARKDAGASMALGARVEIKRAWVQVCSRPSPCGRNAPADGAAVALVFGNDDYEVVGEEGEWVRVRLGDSREGWIPRAVTQ